MEDLCISCKKEPIFIKRRQLCKKCYPQLRNKEIKERTGSGSNAHQQWIQHTSEVEFIKNFFTHNNWHYHPAMFRANGFRYTPDFYDITRDMFIEVAGTPQAYYRNKEKYAKFQEAFPALNFEIRFPDGTLLDSNNKSWNKQGNEEILISKDDISSETAILKKTPKIIN